MMAGLQMIEGTTFRGHRAMAAMGSGAVLGVALISAGLPDRASAGLLDPYVGGAVGQGQVSTHSGQVPEPTDLFRENHSAFKIVAGIRPMSLLGAEVEYVDFGHPNGSLGAAPADATMTGAAAFGVLYLPIPIVDVFLKAGGARLQTTIDGNAYEACPANGILPGGNCPPSVPFRVDRTTLTFAGGAGLQYKWGSLAVRAEYERFTTVGEHPRLVSIGATWTF